MSDKLLDSAGDVGRYISHAYDQTTDSQYISYYDATTRRLKYATDMSGSWETSYITTSGDIGKYSAIAVDGNDVVHILSFDQGKYPARR